MASLGGTAMTAVSRGLAVSVILVGLWAQAAPRAASVATLRDQLHSADVAVAVAAAISLGSIRGNAAAEALLEALRLGAPPKLAIALLEAVSRHAAPRAFLLVRHYCGHRNAGVRPAALRTIARLAHKDVDAVLLDALDDSDASVRATAAALVGIRKVTRAESLLLELLARGDRFVAAPLGQVASAQTATRLAEMVGSIPHEAIADAYGEMLKRSDFGPDPLRVKIVEALGRIQGVASTAALLEYVASIPSGEVRRSKRMAQQILAQRE